MDVYGHQGGDQDGRCRKRHLGNGNHHQTKAPVRYGNGRRRREADSVGLPDYLWQAVYIDLGGKPNNTSIEYLLYSLSNNEFTQIEGYYAKYDGTGYLVIDLLESYPVLTDDAGAAYTGSSEAYVYEEPTGNQYLVYEDGSRLQDKSATTSTLET